MKSKSVIFFVLLMIIPLISCDQEEKASDTNIIYLHHSTGGVIWEGDSKSLFSKTSLPLLFKKYNKENDKYYAIKEMTFPKASPYGWNNYPYDYYNIWVRNAGDEPFMEEPTLEMLTKEYQVIIFKHCFPVSNVQADMESADINSDVKTLSNYKLQYQSLQDKLHEFPDTKFILFTGAIQVKSQISEDEAKRAKEFYEWVTDEWDITGDNVFIWDLYGLQTDGGIYFKDEYAASQNDSHPNTVFAGKTVKLLFNRIIDIIENNGNETSLTGVNKS